MEQLLFKRQTRICQFWKEMTEKRGMMKLGWMSCWRGDNYWIFSETLKLEVIKRNLRVKESTFLFTTSWIFETHDHRWHQVAKVSDSKHDETTQGGEQREPLQACQTLRHPIQLRCQSWDNSQVLFMLFYLTPKHLLLARAWVRVPVWRNLALDLIWPLSADGYGCTFEKHC